MLWKKISWNPRIGCTLKIVLNAKNSYAIKQKSREMLNRWVLEITKQNFLIHLRACKTLMLLYWNWIDWPFHHGDSEEVKKNFFCISFVLFYIYFLFKQENRKSYIYTTNNLITDKKKQKKREEKIRAPLHLNGE